MTSNIWLLRPDEIDPSLARQWSQLQVGVFDRPFFSLEYARAIERVRGGVRILVAAEGDRAQVIWPMQRRHRLMAEPTGFGVSDFQGPLVRHGIRFDAANILRKSRHFLTYDFDHLCDPSGSLARWSSNAHPSPFIAIDPALDEFHSALRSRRSRLLRRVAFKRNRLEREVGTVAFEASTRGASDLDDMLKHKRQQYRRTGRIDGLGESWRRQLLVNLHNADNTQCEGVLSVLRVGGKPIGWHYGLRNENTLNWWFPVYDPEFGRHSPGLILLHETVKHEARVGTRLIDLGTGESEYKARFATGATAVFMGCVPAQPGIGLTRRALQRVRANW